MPALGWRHAALFVLVGTGEPAVVELGGLWPGGEQRTMGDLIDVASGAV